MRGCEAGGPLGVPVPARRRRGRRALALIAALCPLALVPRAEAAPEESASAVASPVRPGLGTDPRAASGYAAMEFRQFVRAREVAEAMLRSDPGSPEGHCLLGVVYHLGEGSLPRALFHLTRSIEAFEERYGPTAEENEPWLWHSRAIVEAASVSGAMGKDGDKVRLLHLHEEKYQSDQRASLGWPLMRLRRYREARATVTEAIRSPDRSSHQLATALNAICAIEGEEQHRVQTHRACMATVEHDRQYGFDDPVAYTNAAIGARGLLRFDEAERLLLEASEHFAQGTVSNPWMDLMLLYMGQGRAPEALGAMRRMFAWRNRQPPYMDDQMRAQTDIASALLLLISGRSADAVRISSRSLSRPDRTGYTSSDTEQMEAASALVHGLALRALAEQKREEASWAPWRAAWSARLQAWRADFAAWRAGRRVASMLAEERILVSSLRPYLPGALEISPWTLLDIPRLIGPGAAEAAVDVAREVETLEAGADGYFAALETYIAALRGQDASALESAERALAQLPAPEVLMQAQVAMLGAQGAFALGQADRGTGLLSRAIQIDPGVVRRTRASIPTRFARPEGAIAEQVIDLLQDSPRLDADSEGRFSVGVEADEGRGRACLRGPQGEILGCADVSREPDETPDAFAREIAAEFHRTVFAPRVDLTQSDIQSLDGSPTAAGGRARDRMNSILDSLVAPEQH